jgi:hypothetical protein
MDFTTLARVKVATGVQSNAQDALLAQMITSVSVEMERSMLRPDLVELKSRTAEIAIPWPDMQCSLPTSPATSITSIKVSPSRDWTNTDALVEGSDYVLRPKPAVVDFLTELPYFRSSATGRPIHPTHAQVVYLAGFATNTAGLIAAYPDLAAACDMQIRYQYQRRDSLGSNFDTSQGSTSFKAEYDWLPSVKRTLFYYRRKDL